nr:ATP-binding cassette domain-containing protein [bacterium]
MPVGIRIDSLHKSFGASRAIDGVTLSLSEGRLHGLIGSDGAGKTTLIRLILGLLDADDGRSTFTEDGSSVGLAELRNSISYMPGRPSLYPDLSVAEHLEFFRDIYMMDKAEFAASRDRLLRITRLDRFEDRKAGELSGGMYKKLG